jgi:Protein of unknown function (DUF3866)
VLSLRRGTVNAIGARAEGLVRLEVDARPCIAFPRLTGPVAIGDDVLVNVQALDLDLGSGGFDILHANLTRGLDLPSEPGAHVMKLPYTSLQHAVRHVEEDSEPGDALRGMPVVCCSLHSQLVPACAGLGQELRVAYVQLAGGALPVSLSDAVRALRERGYVFAAVAAGPAVDGDSASASLPSALVWCRSRGAEAVVCAPGPGIVGTGTFLGHGAVAAAEATNVAQALGGVPVLAARVSAQDERERHRCLSHHTRAVLALSLARVRLAWPSGVDVPAGLTADLVDVDGWETECDGLPLSHMGRGPSEDPVFFATAFAAGRLAREAAR